jgi:hypothetical protein
MASEEHVEVSKIAKFERKMLLKCRKEYSPLCSLERFVKFCSYKTQGKLIPTAGFKFHASRRPDHDTLL